MGRGPPRERSFRRSVRGLRVIADRHPFWSCAGGQQHDSCQACCGESSSAQRQQRKSARHRAQRSRVLIDVDPSTRFKETGERSIECPAPEKTIVSPGGYVVPGENNNRNGGRAQPRLGVVECVERLAVNASGVANMPSKRRRARAGASRSVRPHAEHRTLPASTAVAQENLDETCGLVLRPISAERFDCWRNTNDHRAVGDCGR